VLARKRARTVDAGMPFDIPIELDHGGFAGDKVAGRFAARDDKSLAFIAKAQIDRFRHVTFLSTSAGSIPAGPERRPARKDGRVPRLWLSSTAEPPGSADRQSGISWIAHRQPEASRPALLRAPKWGFTMQKSSFFNVLNRDIAPVGLRRFARLP
jgi:hypothetical protein